MFGGIPLETVIIFGVGSFVTKGITDSNNFGYWKIVILENGREGLDGIILHNSDEWKIKDTRHQISRYLTNLFP